MFVWALFLLQQQYKHGTHKSVVEILYIHILPAIPLHTSNTFKSKYYTITHTIYSAYVRQTSAKVQTILSQINSYEIN